MLILLLLLLLLFILYTVNDVKLPQARVFEEMWCALNGRKMLGQRGKREGGREGGGREGGKEEGMNKHAKEETPPWLKTLINTNYCCNFKKFPS